MLGGRGAHPTWNPPAPAAALAQLRSSTWPKPAMGPVPVLSQHPVDLPQILRADFPLARLDILIVPPIQTRPLRHLLLRPTAILAQFAKIVAEMNKLTVWGNHAAQNAPPEIHRPRPIATYFADFFQAVKVRQ